MNLLHRNFLLLCLTFFIFSPVTLFGQGISSSSRATSTTSVSQESKLISHINTTGSLLFRQDGRNLYFIVKVKNLGKALSDIKYRIVLYQKDAPEKYVDQYVSLETFDLGEKESKAFSVAYVVPESISGTYNARIFVELASGFRIATERIKKQVTLAPLAQGIFIDSSSCYLKIKGEVSSQKYTSDYIVGIKKDEILIGSCDVLNLAKEAVTIAPTLDTFFRSEAGTLISSYISTTSLYTLLPNKKQQVSFEIPLPADPQKYKTSLYFKDKEKVISNRVELPFVLLGTTATIDTFTLDKKDYANKEVATARLTWSSAVPAYRGKENVQGTILKDFKANISVIDSDGDSCSDVKSFPLKKSGGGVSFDIPINKKCLGAVPAVLLVEGEMPLASLYIDNFAYGSFIPEKIPQNKDFGIFARIVLSSFVLLIGLFIIYWLRKKNIIIVSIVFTILFSSFFTHSVFASETQTTSMTDERDNTHTISVVGPATSEGDEDALCTEEDGEDSDKYDGHDGTIDYDIDVGGVDPFEQCKDVDDYKGPISSRYAINKVGQAVSWGAWVEGDRSVSGPVRPRPDTYSAQFEFKSQRVPVEGGSGSSDEPVNQCDDNDYPSETVHPEDDSPLEFNFTVRKGCDICYNIKDIQTPADVSMTSPGDPAQDYLVKRDDYICVRDACSQPGAQRSPPCEKAPTPPGNPFNPNPTSFCNLYPAHPICNPPPPPPTDLCTLPAGLWPGIQSAPVLFPYYASSTLGYCPTDYCRNIAGNQLFVPVDRYQQGEDCLLNPKPADLCTLPADNPRWDGIQTGPLFPPEYTSDTPGYCYVDECTNLPGNQDEVPLLYVQEDDGYGTGGNACLPDICENISGQQLFADLVHPLYASSTVAGICYIDHCTDMAGYQAEVPSGYTELGDGICVMGEDLCVLPEGQWDDIQTAPLPKPDYASTTPGYCYTDMCLNQGGYQMTLPDGYVADQDWNCSCAPGQTQSRPSSEACSNGEVPLSGQPSTQTRSFTCPGATAWSPAISCGNNLPEGVFETASCTGVTGLTGYARDFNPPLGHLLISFYDNPSGSGQALLSGSTDSTRVISAETYFTFNIPIPNNLTSLRDGGSHTLYAFARDANQPTTKGVLSGSQTISGCLPQDVSLESLTPVPVGNVCTVRATAKNQAWCELKVNGDHFQDLAEIGGNVSPFVQDISKPNSSTPQNFTLICHTKEEDEPDDYMVTKTAKCIPAKFTEF